MATSAKSIAKKLMKASKNAKKGTKVSVDIELNEQGLQELLKSPEMEQAVKEQADQIANTAGEGYSSDTKMMGTRVIASAYTDTVDAMKDNMENNTLLKSIHGDYKKS